MGQTLFFKNKSGELYWIQFYFHFFFIIIFLFIHFFSLLFGAGCVGGGCGCGVLTPEVEKHTFIVTNNITKYLFTYFV